MRYVQCGEQRLTLGDLAAVAAKYWLDDKKSIIKVAYFERFGEPYVDTLKDEPVLVGERGRFKVHEYSTGFAVEDTTTGKQHWLSDGVDVMTQELRRHDGEIEDIGLLPGLPFFVELWEDSFNHSEDETEEAYFPSTTALERAAAEAMELARIREGRQ